MILIQMHVGHSVLLDMGIDHRTALGQRPNQMLIVSYIKFFNKTDNKLKIDLPVSGRRNQLSLSKEQFSDIQHFYESDFFFINYCLTALILSKMSTE